MNARPEPARAELGRVAALAALGVALLAAIAVAGARPGLGLAAAAVAAVAVGAAAGGERRAWFDWACLAAAIALAAAPLYRDTTWLIVGDLVLAVGLAAIALVDARAWRTILAVPLVLAARVAEAPLAVARSAAGALPSRPRSAMPVLRAGILAGVLVSVFGFLFVAADRAFARMVERLTPELPQLGDLPERALVGVLALAVAAGLALHATRGLQVQERPAERRGIAPVEWKLALGALVGLFSAFVAVQFLVLFGGHRHVLETAGLTYSEYARQGFAELLAVAALAIAVVGGAWRWTELRSERDRRVLRVLLAALCALTLVIVASALHRLDLYVEAFGATRLRLEAAVVCAWIGALLVLMLVSTATSGRAWLPRAAVAITAAFAVGFTLANPEGWIAGRNVDRYERTGKLDVAYNASLSADAVPQLARVAGPVGNRLVLAQRSRLESADGFGGFNIARERARSALAPD